MKKTVLMLIGFITIVLQTIRAQETEHTSIPLETKNHFSDKLVFDLYHDLWKNVPENMDLRTIQQGVNFYLMFNIPLGNSNFSLAPGFGLSSHNLYSNAVPVPETIGGNPTQLSGKTIFINLDNYYNRKIDYSINKLNVTYLDIPFEIRFKTNAERKHRFRMSVGGKIGLRISDHTKFKGEDILDNTDETIVYKKHNIANISNWSYGALFRIGYGMFNVYAYYSGSKLFEKDKGPQIYPISVGISIIPF